MSLCNRIHGVLRTCETCKFFYEWMYSVRVSHDHVNAANILECMRLRRHFDMQRKNLWKGSIDANRSCLGNYFMQTLAFNKKRSWTLEKVNWNLSTKNSASIFFLFVSSSPPSFISLSHCSAAFLQKFNSIDGGFFELAAESFPRLHSKLRTIVWG